MHEEAVKMTELNGANRLPAVFDKKGDGQFRMVGSLGRNARKLGASGPSPVP